MFTWWVFQLHFFDELHLLCWKNRIFTKYEAINANQSTLNIEKHVGFIVSLQNRTSRLYDIDSFQPWYKVNSIYKRELWVRSSFLFCISKSVIGNKFQSAHDFIPPSGTLQAYQQCHMSKGNMESFKTYFLLSTFCGEIVHFVLMGSLPKSIREKKHFAFIAHHFSRPTMLLSSPT